MRAFLTAAVAASALIIGAGVAAAQDVTLRLHHFMPGPATLPKGFLGPWAEKIAAESDGRLQIEVFHGMSLGGRPGDLYDQAVDGAVDIILTLPGYTPGRFNRAEVFELPFMMEDTVATAMAFNQLIEDELQDQEFDEAKILGAWVHGPGVLHSKSPITSLEDMVGQEVRGPTRVITDMLGELGATPVGMPLPAIPENLSKGVISGTVLPWEITPAIKLGELVTNHTEISGDEALYTAVFVMAMNWDAYDALPDDLRAVLDANSGAQIAEGAATVMVAADAGGRKVWEDAGNSMLVLDEAEVARWKQAVQPVYARWVERAGNNGFDGQVAIDQAKALIADNQ